MHKSFKSLDISDMGSTVGSVLKAHAFDHSVPGSILGLSAIMSVVSIGSLLCSAWLVLTLILLYSIPNQWSTCARLNKFATIITIPLCPRLTKMGNERESFSPGA